LDISPLVWIITIAVTIAFFVFEFFAHVRKPHEPSIGEAARWSAFYIGLALLFGVGIGLVSGWGFGGEYFAGYLTEKALSVDNIFVFLLVMSAFAVPREYQQKVLLIGIVIALVMRTIFILLGTAVVFCDVWSPERGWELITAKGCTVIVDAPPGWQIRDLPPRP